MNNFLEFIKEDIEVKKTLISTLPVNTKTNIKKFNDKIETLIEKYDQYKVSVKKYIDTKSNSFVIKPIEKQVNDINNKITSLERVKFVLNPSNTYFEKMGFDNLLYEISNYNDFNFESLNKTITSFFEKFEMVNIKLKNEEFDYTCYVNEYMTKFQELREKKESNFEILAETFEKIYWESPELVSHIELNFRKLIKKYEKKFTKYVVEMQKKITEEEKILSYNDCLEKLLFSYKELRVLEQENITDIINLALKGTIDMANYFKDSKSRTSTYESLSIIPINYENESFMSNFYDDLRKLKENVLEFDKYNQFVLLFKNFKEEYEKMLSVDKKVENKGLKNIIEQIEKREKELYKINKKISKSGSNWFKKEDIKETKQLKLQSTDIANELYTLYKTFDNEYFIDKVLNILNQSLTVADLFHLYYSFDYFKKIAIKKVFEIETYDELIKFSDNFDLFAMDPTNIIVNGIKIFEDNNISTVIMNKYRLSNINLTEELLNPDNLKPLIDKIDLILRCNIIDNSTTTVEKIWFMASVEKINEAERKKMQENAGV